MKFGEECGGFGNGRKREVKGELSFAWRRFMGKGGGVNEEEEL